MKLHINVVTPEKTILDEDIDEVIIPTITGEITILPQHIPLLSQIAPGELTIKKGNATEHLVVVGGFLEVGNNIITILADHAVHAKNIILAKAQEAKERAEKAMKDGELRIMNYELGLKDNLFSDITKISKQFAVQSGLLGNKEIKKTISAIEKKGGSASMIMLGNAVWSSIPFEGEQKYAISSNKVILL